MSWRINKRCTIRTTKSNLPWILNLLLTDYVTCIIFFISKRAVFELENYKKKTQLQIQGLTWKSKVSEIHITSLKSLLNQKHEENKRLKKLVDEMILKVDEMKPLEFGV